MILLSSTYLTMAGLRVMKVVVVLVVGNDGDDGEQGSRCGPLMMVDGVRKKNTSLSYAVED